MPSRRRLLAALGSGAVAGLAGCSGSNSGGSDTVDCHTSAVSHGDGDVLDGGAMARVDGEDVRLVVPLSVDAVREQNVAVLEVYDDVGAEGYIIPVSPNDADLMANKPGVSEGQLYYEQYLGERPFHGRYTVAARNGDDEVVDTVTVQFNCFPEVEDE
ncbi:hypothetical protein [Halorarius halobius]|uniref:hypothetical protein n=1 Tax=Halorarius halobius TaxID=2962671 RepID=UPI0020CBB4F3|nr:hypothetical protein [Halorarius halobius]